MELTVMNLFVFLIAAGLVSAHLVRIGFSFLPTGAKRWGRTVVGRQLVEADQPTLAKSSWAGWSLCLAGVAGVIGSLLAVSYLNLPIWLPWMMLVLAIILEEGKSNQPLSVLPDVIHSLAIVRAAAKRGYGLFDILSLVIHSLPPGRVRAAVQSVQMNCRRGQPVSQCFLPLKKCNRHLANLICQLQSAGWEIDQVPDLAIYHLLRRARLDLDTQQHAWRLAERLAPWLMGLQAGLLGGAWGMALSQIVPANVRLGSLSPQFVLMAGLSAVILSLMTVHTDPRVRRAGMAIAFVVCLGIASQAANVNIQQAALLFP